MAGFKRKLGQYKKIGGESRTHKNHNLLELVDITRTFQRGSIADVQALSKVNLRIQAGEFVAITGPSGSGKSTLLNILGCLDRPTIGEYLLLNESILDLPSESLASLRRTTFGFVFQDLNLLEGISIIENIELPSTYTRLQQRIRRGRAMSLISFVGLQDHIEQETETLSGGEQQRVAIARALMNHPKVLLADEPTGSLDSQNANTILSLLRNLVEKGYTVIVVTHDPYVASWSDRIVRLEQGRIVTDESTIRTPDKQSSGNNSFVTNYATGGHTNPQLGYHRGYDFLRTNVLIPLRESITTYRTRAAITGLSVIISIWSVLALVGVFEANYRRTVDAMADMGAQAIYVRPLENLGLSQAEPVMLTVGDADALRNLEHVEFALPLIRRRMEVNYLDRSYQAEVWFTSTYYFESHDVEIALGTQFTSLDDETQQSVVVVGSEVWDNLFTNWNNPVGQFVSIEGEPFLIKGVTRDNKKLGLSALDLSNRRIIAPIRSIEKLVGVNIGIDSIEVHATDPNRLNETLQKIYEVLTKRHGSQAFGLHLDQEIQFGFNKIEKLVATLVSFVGAISLVSGGVGVMSLMLMSVRRRTREIGIRIACGARQRDILLRFLTEAVAVTTIGGLVGLAIAIISLALLSFFGLPVTLSGIAVLLAITCAFATGLLFGIVPASRAATLDPRDALSR